MGVLRAVDRTFRADYGFNATNSDGYIVDLLCPESDDFPKMNAGSDLEAQPMPGAQWLLQCPQHEQIIVGEDGIPLRMVVPEIRTFALHKLWVSQRTDRNPIKRPRDRQHAQIVTDLTYKYLNLPFGAQAMPWLPPQLRSLIKVMKPTPV